MTRAILTAAERYVPLPYGHPRSRSDLSVIDCSTLTAHVLDDVLGAWAPSLDAVQAGTAPAARWVGGLSSAAWLDVVIGDGTRPWSPIERAVADGWGVAADAPTAPGWYLLQAWRAIPTSGHAMLVCSTASGLAVLEATSAGPRGVRWRRAAVRAPLPLTVEDAPRWTLEALAADYPAGLRWARLTL